MMQGCRTPPPSPHGTGILPPHSRPAPPVVVGYGGLCTPPPLGLLQVSTLIMGCLNLL